MQSSKWLRNHKFNSFRDILFHALREGVKNIFLQPSPKQRTPPTPTIQDFPEDWRKHEKRICSELSNMPYKHDIVFSLKSLGLLTPTHPQFRKKS